MIYKVTLLQIALSQEHVFPQPFHGLLRQRAGQGKVHAYGVRQQEVLTVLPYDPAAYSPLLELGDAYAVAAAEVPAVQKQHIGALGTHHLYAGEIVPDEAAGIVQVALYHLYHLLGPGLPFRAEAADKGVRVRAAGGRLVVDLHIAVTYGVNISAIVNSIINKVRYTVEEATGLEVAKVNVFVDSMKS